MRELKEYITFGIENINNIKTLDIDIEESKLNKRG